MTQDDVQALLAEMAEIQIFLEHACDALREGKVVSLAGFDQTIATLCDKVGEAGKEEKQSFLPELASLLNRVNQYEASLREFSQSEKP